MDDKLIQELAVQIDGQIAQSCGSHDPNAKGNYILQKYPQVRTCANYNEAIFLLAKEQAVLQTQPTQGFTQPQGFGHSPQKSFGQMPNAFGQMQNGFVPQSGYTQTAQGFGQPPTPGVFGTPAVPLTGVPGASQFTAFQPQTPPKESNGKVFGFIPSNVFAIVLIGLFVFIIIFGVVKSAINVKKSKDTQVEHQVEQQVDPIEQPSVGTIDDLFD